MNNGALQFTGLYDLVEAVGKRPGELLGCIHSAEEPGGCGTSEACTYCGAVIAILMSQKGNDAVEECRLVIGPNKFFDLRVWASPLVVNGEEFYALTIQNIEHEKRRTVLERIFFHDILNTTQGLLSAIENLRKYWDKIERKEFLDRLDNLINSLVDEIKSQQTLLAAESKDLTISLSTFNSKKLLSEFADFYAVHSIARGKTLQINPNAVSIEITSDRDLLKRILRNIIKNALEATPDNGIVTLGCEVNEEKIHFWIHNPGFIPRNIQLQIFQRSFSTKGPGRGLGTYSIKLLSSFLEGTVSFSTSEAEGTTFKASFPIKLKAY